MARWSQILAVAAVVTIATGLAEAWGFLTSSELSGLNPAGLYALAAIGIVAAIALYALEEGEERGAYAYAAIGKRAYRYRR